MTSTVTLALVGDPARRDEGISHEEWLRPWEEWPKVDLDVEPGETLGSLMARAFKELEIGDPNAQTSPHFFADVVLAGEGRPAGWHDVGHLALVDHREIAFWSVWDYRLIPYDELVRAQQVGALRGDPRKLALVLRPTVGNGLLLDWPSLLRVWDITWEIAKDVGVVGGVVATAKLAIDSFQKRLHRGREAARANVYRWSQRGGTPTEIHAFLGDREWSSEKLARFLDCSEDDAVGILAIFGFSLGDDGLWHLRGDETGRLLSDLIEDSLAFGAYADDAELRNRVEFLLKTGRTKPTIDYELPEYSWYGNLVVRERIKRAVKASAVAAAAFAAGRLLPRRK